jgi:hypothetical protein
MLDGVAQLAQSAFKEMVASIDEDQLFRFRNGCKHLTQLRTRAELIARSADEEFRLAASSQEIVFITAIIDRSNRSSQANQSLHAWIRAGGAQTNRSAKGEPCKYYWATIFVF